MSRAAVLGPDRVLDLIDVADPIPGPGEALIAVDSCGICGSDLHLGAQLAPPGRALGHEISGTVVALGPGLDERQCPIGRSVAVRPLVGCGSCTWCIRGRADHCTAFELIGLHRSGGFAELVTAPAAELFTLPSEVGAIERALVEPLAIAHRAISRTRWKGVRSVLIAGGGPIGLALVAWLRAGSDVHVTVSEPSPDRRRLARRLGADLAIDPTGAGLDTVLDGFGVAPPDVVFECTGRRGVLQDGIGVAAVDGQVTVVGICLGRDEIVPWSAIHKELDVHFAIYYERSDFRDTIEALEAGWLRPAAMVTETIGLDQLPARFAQLRHEANGGKVLLRP